MISLKPGYPTRHSVASHSEVKVYFYFDRSETLMCAGGKTVKYFNYASNYLLACAQEYTFSRFVSNSVFDRLKVAHILTKSQ
jgi:hypothetical protein